MNAPLKQHLIDPEICIRCYTCENTCPIEAITHDDSNVVVDAERCDQCMDCIPVCPTGSIDNWRLVETPYTLEEQFDWDELPEQAEIAGAGSAHTASIEALDDGVAALLAEAHAGAGGRTCAPASASKPTINLYNINKPAAAIVQGNYRLTAENADSDVRHIILDMGAQPLPLLEGQSVGIIPPGADADGKAHLPRLYSVSSPRDGERPGYNNFSLTVKREDDGLCSNFLCDLEKGATVSLTGPFGTSFLMPNDATARVLMICTGTGSAPFRAFTMHRQRSDSQAPAMTLFFGARTPEALPYFGPLKKVPESVLRKFLVYSRVDGQPRCYVQDALRAHPELAAGILADEAGYIYICGLRGMEEGVEQALEHIATGQGLDWQELKARMRETGRYHVETY